MMVGCSVVVIKVVDLCCGGCVGVVFVFGGK